jgi:hypothetical protein
LKFKKFKKIFNGSQIVDKNVTNLMVKTVSELESRVKNYRGKAKKQKDGAREFGTNLTSSKRRVCRSS